MRRATALAVDTKVKDGIMTSSPGPMLQSRTACSRAAVADRVSNAFEHPSFASSQCSHATVYLPKLSSL